MSELIDKATGKELLYGVYRGIVEDNVDPDHRGRIKVRVPSIHGIQADISTELLPWCIVAMNQSGGYYNEGSYQIPKIGAGVYLMFEQGDDDHPICFGTYISMPKFDYKDGDKEFGRSETPIEAVATMGNKPTVRVMNKTDVSNFWDETMEKFNKLMMEHFPSTFDLRMEEKTVGGKKLKDLRLGNKKHSLRMGEGDFFKGLFLKSLNAYLDFSDDGDEIKLTLLGTHIASLFINKRTGELIVSFKKVTIMSDVEVMGNLNVAGKVVGG